MELYYRGGSGEVVVVMDHRQRCRGHGQNHYAITSCRTEEGEQMGGLEDDVTQWTAWGVTPSSFG